MLLLLQNANAQKTLNDNNYDNSEYGYIEAYGDEAKKSNNHGSEYYDDYEYEDDLDGAIRSLGLAAEVRLPHYKPSLSQEFSFSQRCNCGKEDIESSHDATRIVGGKPAELNRHPWQAECLLPLNKTFYWIDLRFPWPRGMGSTRVVRASYPSVFSRNISHFRKFYVTNLIKPQAPCINSSPLYKGSKDRL